MMISQRFRVPTAIAAAVAIVFAVSLLAASYRLQTAKPFRWPFRNTKTQLHLLLPATASNLNLCKLLLSSTIAGFPNPILLGWEGHGQYNGSKSHLFKISETLAYLNTLPASADEDIVLVLDAYDVWLQLPPDVLIRRYFQAIDKANKRLKSESIYGVEHGGAVVKQSILFGPDKTCWPDDERRAACWAVPESSLPDDIFGPATDTWMVPNRPRWLNSGTIMGPAKDISAMFAGTMDVVRRKYDEKYELRNSDQFYFQEMWAEQEIGRLALQNGGEAIAPPLLRKEVYGIVPKIPADQRTEFHVALDYGSNAFQTSAAYTEYLTWMSFNHSTHQQPQSAHGTSAPTTRRMDQFVLDDDVLRSRAPFAAVEGNIDEALTKKTWTDVMLGTNMATQQVFPVWHMTGEKSYRTRWWSRMWFHPHAEALLEAAKRAAVEAVGRDGGRVVAEVGGVEYIGAEIHHGESAEEHSYAGVGAWTDRGNWIGWDDLCASFSGELFLE